VSGVRTVLALGALCIGVTAASGASAATQAATPHKATDLSTTAKIHSYLRSIGVNPRGVVIQRGERNYVGPNCPGKGWNCTKGLRVFQLGSQNTAECTGNQCTGLVQTGDRNTFRCDQRTNSNPALQECSVRQMGSWNFARFDQVVDQDTKTDAEQDATQIVRVTQQGTGPSSKNELHVFQRIEQSMSTPGEQTQDGLQFILPFEGFANVQESSSAGRNYAQLHQYLNVQGAGAATAQNQNTEVGNAPLCNVGPPGNANQCVDVPQETGDGGKNETHLHQLIDENAKTTVGGTQTQGNVDGGNVGRVHQEVGGVEEESVIAIAGGTGSSEAHAHQARRQSASGGSSSDQIDPTRCCGVSQEGGTGNSMDINQSAGQTSNAENSNQDSTLIGECRTIPGTCSAHHHGKNNNANESFSQSCDPGAEACVFTLTTLCTSNDSDETEGSGECGPPEPFPDLTSTASIFTATNFLPGTPLTGFEVTMGLVEPVLALP
jgi:hypothetical protein